MFWCDVGVTLFHLGLDSDRALDRVHHTRKFGKNTTAGSVDDAPAKPVHHRKHNGLMSLEITHRARLVGAHQRAIPSNIRGQDSRESARLAVGSGSLGFHNW